MITIMKGFTGIGGFLILAIGVVMLGITIWGFFHTELTFDNYTLLGILMAADFIIISVAIIGICGIKKANGFMICLFQIFVIVFFLGFLGIGIAANTLPKTVFEGNCTSSDNKYVEIAYNSYNVSVGLCSVACPCGLTNDAIKNGNYTAI